MTGYRKLILAGIYGALLILFFYSNRPMELAIAAMVQTTLAFSVLFGANGAEHIGKGMLKVVGKPKIKGTNKPEDY